MTNRTDDFTRANSSTSLGTPSDGGSAWTALSGTWGINSNEGYVATTSGSWDYAELQASVADVTVQVTAATINTGSSFPGVIARNDATTSNRLFWFWHHSAVVLRMYKVVNGGFTQLGSDVSYTAASGDVFKFSCTGSTLNGYVNGTLKLGPITDSAGSTNTRHGLISFDDTAVRYTNFSITASGGTTIALATASWLWTGIAPGVDATTKLTLANAAWNWSGIAPGINAKTRLALGAVNWAWNASGLNVLAQPIVMLATASWRWFARGPVVNPGSFVAVYNALMKSMHRMMGR